MGRYKGALASVRPDELAARLLHHLALPFENLPQQRGLVALGCANQAGEDSRNVARQAQLLAQLPFTWPAFTTNQLCASGALAIMQAAQALQQGQATFALAGGVESMSRSPLAQLPPHAWPHPAQPTPWEDTTLGWRFTHPAFEALGWRHSMMQTVEQRLKTHPLPTALMHAVVLQSHARALATEALTAPLRFEVAGRTVDEPPRVGLNETVLNRLTPLEPQGQLTAATMAPFADGAAGVVLATEEGAAALGVSPTALSTHYPQVRGWAMVGCNPLEMVMGPTLAVEALRQQYPHMPPLEAFTVIELHEAFAAGHLWNSEALGLAWNDTRINAWGGALALGAPMGAVGGHLITTLCGRLQQAAATGAAPQPLHALVAMGVGMGQGLACWLSLG
jgi:acetyl-CoA acetyltransferase family protein